MLGQHVNLLYLWDNLSPIAKQDQNSFNPFSSATWNWLIILRMKLLSAGAGFSPARLQLHYFRDLGEVSWLPLLAVIPSTWWAPTERLCLSHPCDHWMALGSAATGQVCSDSPWRFERSLLTAAGAITERVICTALACLKEFTFKSGTERWLPEDMKRATWEWSQMI